MRSMAGHPLVERLRGQGAVLDGNVSKGHLCIGDVNGQFGVSHGGSPQFRMEAAVIENFEEQAQEVSER